MDQELKKQQEQLRKTPKIDVVDACGVNSGIVQLEDDALEKLVSIDFNANSCFFIPASGAGSRMFGFLFQFLADGIETPEVKLFFRKLENFPFFPLLKAKLGEAFEKMNQQEIVSFLLSAEGFDLAELPKGLIPFHQYGEQVLVPFAEHLLQIDGLEGFPKKVQYTVQKDCLNQIDDVVKAANQQFDVTYSFQDPSTDAYCFDLQGEPIKLGDDFLRRPAGHGALLKNLNEVSEEVLFVKNIDNIQPRSREGVSLRYWSALNGLLKKFKKSLAELRKNYSQDALKRFNEEFELFRKEDLEKIDLSDIELMCSRPSRVCGMVINEGAPGGGPFWVQQNGIATKQIVEKVQFGDSDHEKNIINKSSHFNPVFMVLDKSNVNGDRCDLEEFVDREAFIRVEKDQKGQKVIYHELPGLWNGSMAYWNTIFVEVPKTVFTPVKTVLDLIGEEHLS